ncbi:hypothetical protein [Halopseudomonas bauzanensis]|uniref:hypothetical protein n=1 Tax=Halopseudomonas bauzanensis TaxID=653930 RepID=UPI003FA0712D
MGWLFSYRNRMDLIQKLLAPDRNYIRNRKVLQHALVGNELWMVVRLKLKIAGVVNDNAVGDVYTFIVCELLACADGLWGHKSIPEEMGPFYYGCPLHFLDITPDGNNPEWRAKLREIHRQRAPAHSVQERDAALFPTGKVVMTRAVYELVRRGLVNPYPYLQRHLAGDWGDLCDEDKAVNLLALDEHGQLFSSYVIPVEGSPKLWVITEGDRSVTTLLLPSDY